VDVGESVGRGGEGKRRRVGALAVAVTAAEVDSLTLGRGRMEAERKGPAKHASKLSGGLAVVERCSSSCGATPLVRR
jgi:hypothetical protein